MGEEGPQQKISDFISGLSEQRLDPDWDHNHPSTPTCETLGTVSCTCALTVFTAITLGGVDMAQGSRLWDDLLRVCLPNAHLHTLVSCGRWQP